MLPSDRFIIQAPRQAMGDVSLKVHLSSYVGQKPSSCGKNIWLLW